MDRYIEHIINDLVRDTRIDYDQDRIYFPFALLHLPFDVSTSLFVHNPPIFSPPLYSDYCKKKYGLTEEEIKYVWRGYVGILKDKITKRKP